MRARRVLITGMGGELGSLVAALLEREPWVGSITGLDLDPPRRRLRHASFHLVHPTDVTTISDLVADADPEVLVHLAVYEPDARANAGEAALWTPSMVEAIEHAASRLPSLERIVVRSSIDVYGRTAAPPDETSPTVPITPFGRQVADAEVRLSEIAKRCGATVGLVRLAPVIGSHVPSPLGRLLRLPVVPISWFGSARFSVVAARDAARALIAAGAHGLDGPVNVVANGDVSLAEAVRSGGHLPLPVFGPQWLVARPVTRLAGAPIPAHVQELMGHGLRADGSNAARLLGVHPLSSTVEVIRSVHSWERVIRVPSASLSAPV